MSAARARRWCAPIGCRAACSPRRWERLEVAVGVPLDLVGPHEELRVWHELLHRADVHLARAQACRADGLLELVPVRDVLGLEVQRLGAIIEHVPERLGILAV